MVLPPFRFLPSPFFDHRPCGTVVDLLVVHAISLPPGRFGGRTIDDLFLGRLFSQEWPVPGWQPKEEVLYREVAGLRVSAHFLIDRLGNLTQYVPILCRAWHAGQSVWHGRSQCNNFSIGVELEGDAHTPFTPIQYQRLVEVVCALHAGLVERGQVGLNRQQITGHQHIAPGRKWDPGPCFDWERLWVLLDQAGSVVAWPFVWDCGGLGGVTPSGGQRKFEKYRAEPPIAGIAKQSASDGQLRGEQTQWHTTCT